MRRPAGNGPKTSRAASSPTLVEAGSARADYSDLVELARRMSIPEDDAIRSALDRAMGLPATEGTAEHR